MNNLDNHKPVFIKHLVTCKCFLPIFQEHNINHKFVVFSELERESGAVVRSFAQCNNCGVIHKVTEVGVSEIMRKEESIAIPKVEEIKPGMPSWLSNALETHDCDISTWQEAQFVYENKLWGTPVVLAKEKEDSSTTIIKYILIIGETLFKIQTYQRDEQ